jgi:hypothetical protein
MNNIEGLHSVVSTACIGKKSELFQGCVLMVNREEPDLGITTQTVWFCPTRGRERIDMKIVDLSQLLDKSPECGQVHS